MQLSPFNFTSLMARANPPGEAEPGLSKAAKRHRHIERVVRYVCPDCDDLHDWEDEAEKCCAPSAKIPCTSDCPVCGEHYEEHQEAADCCLWKDIDAPTRWRMAVSVKAGSTWLEQLGIAA